jgi:acetyl-CoA carboxylase biotin carboxyl carrier protein
MNLEDIKQILDLVREHELSEFELERDGLKLRVRKGGPPALAFGAAPAAAPAPVTPAAPAPEPVSTAVASAPAAEDEEAVELAVVKSPIVGTFFRSAEPGAPPCADVGDQVRRGQVLCIIEAMKLMNEIESEYDGEIVSVYVENGQPVQYGERLFAIRVK